MSVFTTDDLRNIMRSSADEDAPVSLDGDFLDTRFDELGYDSLAVLEIATRIQQDYHLPMPDDAVDAMTTPRDVIDYVNPRLQDLSA